jgi:hypothetical protein
MAGGVSPKALPNLVRQLHAMEKIVVAEALAQFLHQEAEGMFAVGVADRAERTVEDGLEFLQVAVVGEDPVAAPHLAHERMAVFKRHLALRGLADMGDHVDRLDRIALDQFGDRRGDGRFVVDEMAHARALEEGDAPAVMVGIGTPAALGKSGETENNVGWDIAVHSKKLTHGCSLPCEAACVARGKC